MPDVQCRPCVLASKLNGQFSSTVEGFDGLNCSVSRCRLGLSLPVAFVLDRIFLLRCSKNYFGITVSALGDKKFIQRHFWGFVWLSGATQLRDVCWVAGGIVCRDLE